MIASRAPWAVWLVGLVAGCGGSAGAPPESGSVASAKIEEPSDSLVLNLPSGHAIWLAEGRSARDSAGKACFERSVDIRTDSSSIKVPLLFVTSPPTLLDRGHLRAELSRDCRVMAIYRVELATGRPEKLEDR